MLTLLTLIVVSIPLIFWYISIWSNEVTTFSDKMFVTGFLSAFHVILSGMIVGMIYTYIDNTGNTGNSRKETK